MLDTKQNANEDETSYSVRICNAIHRYGNVYDEPRKMTFLINGLIPEIQSIVARYLEKTPRHMPRYEELVQFSRDEGQAFGARIGVHRHSQQRKKPSNSRIPDKHLVYFIEPEKIVQDTSPHQQLLYVNDATQSVPMSIATSDLLSA